MADSQNTYQNDVKTKSSNSFAKWFLGIATAVVVAFAGFQFYDTGITTAYNQGFTEGEEEGYSEGYREGEAQGYTDGYDIGKTEGKEEGRNLGYSEGYGKGYNKGKKDAESSSSNKTQYIVTGDTSNYSYSSNEKTYDYILNKNTDKFHYTWCYSVDQMKEKNKIYFTGTRLEVINKGYSPCKNCNP